MRHGTPCKKSVGSNHPESTERQRDRETERQRDRETERQRDRETERQRQREMERTIQRLLLTYKTYIEIMIIQEPVVS